MLDVAAVRRALRDLQPGDEELIPIECRCDPPRRHGPHWVPARRLKKGGALRGRAKLLPGFEA